MISYDKLKYGFALIIGLLLFVACSSDNRTATESDDGSFATLSELISDNPCDSSKVGMTAFVVADSSNYVCKEDPIKKNRYEWFQEDYSFTYELAWHRDSLGVCDSIRFYEFLVPENSLYHCDGGTWQLSEENFFKSYESYIANVPCNEHTKCLADRNMSSHEIPLEKTVPEEKRYICAKSKSDGTWRWRLKANVNYTFYEYCESVRDMLRDGIDEASSSSSSLTLSSSSVKTNSNEGSFKDSRDGHVYRTVTIGSQTWMAENLNYATANSGCYNDSSVYCEKFGRLYTWAGAIDSVGLANDKNFPIVCGDGVECGLAHDLIKGIKKNGSVQGACPTGWRIPTKADFDTLFQKVESVYSDVGKALKSTSGWSSISYDTCRPYMYDIIECRRYTINGNGSDTYGFSALPTKNGTVTGFWSSSEIDKGQSYLLYLTVDRETDREASSDAKREKSEMLPIRCIKGDAFGRPTVAEPLVDSRDGQAYKTVVIGEQTWMAENLNYDTKDSWCYSEFYPGYYPDDIDCRPFGHYYLWSTAVGLGKNANNDATSLPETVQGICPDGWHIPSKKEYEILLNMVGGSDVAGTMLKSLTDWRVEEFVEDGSANTYQNNLSKWHIVDKNGLSDAYGFNAFPGGGRDECSYSSEKTIYEGKTYYQCFGSSGSRAYFVSSTECSHDYAYYLILNADGSTKIACGGAPFFDKGDAKNVRCVKDGGNFVARSSSSVAIEKGRFTDDRDGKSYETVKIGKQTWMAENLNYEIKNSSMKSYCYDDQDSNCTKYGRLYKWASAMDSAGIWSKNGMGCGFKEDCTPTFPVRGVCPNGWHLPDTTEWLSLEAATGGIRAGDNLKASSGWHSCGYGSEYDGANVYGFSALPAGERIQDDFPEYGFDSYYEKRRTYRYECSRTTFWSSNGCGLGAFSNTNGDVIKGYFSAYSYNLGFGGSSFYSGRTYKYNAYSVRCVKDEKNVASYSSSSTRSSSSVRSSSSSLARSSSSLVVSVKGSMTDDRDGRTYKITTIGNQIWMAENLNFEMENSCCYNDIESYCSKYGRLYTWENAKKACPSGWHLPTKTEFETLISTIEGNQYTKGKGLKSTSGWNGGGNGLDSYSFTALPAGGKYDKDGRVFNDEGNNAYFWSSTDSGGMASFMVLFYDYDNVNINVYKTKDVFFSIRCIKD